MGAGDRSHDINDGPARVINAVSSSLVAAPVAVEARPAASPRARPPWTYPML